MPQDKLPIPVCKEGWPFIAPPALLALLSLALGWQMIGGLFALAAAFCLYFFRDPDRTAPEGEDIAVSPADGKVVCVEPVQCDRFQSGKAIKVGIFLSVFDVHVNRSPAAGEVYGVKYVPGKFHNALFDKSSGENEHNIIALETPWGYMEIKQIAGAIARRIVCRVKTGDRLGRGQRFGMIRFGSRTEVYLPLGTEIWVKTGDRVRGGETALGRLVESAKQS